MATRVENSNFAQYLAIGVLQLNFDDGNTYYGTGALIDSKTILTCAHNLTEKGNGAPPKVISINFFPKYNTQPFPLPLNCQVAQGCYSASYAVASSLYKNNQDDWDIGLIKLAQPINVNFYFNPITTVDDSLANEDEQLMITGYPGDKNGEMWTDFDTVANIDIGFNTLLFVVDTQAGSSGSPVYNYNSIDDKIYQYAVHVAKTEIAGLKRAILITPNIMDWINKAKLVRQGNVFLTYL